VAEIAVASKAERNANLGGISEMASIAGFAAALSVARD
jgi:hypothetical protein